MDDVFGILLIIVVIAFIRAIYVPSKKSKECDEELWKILCEEEEKEKEEEEKKKNDSSSPKAT